MNQCVQAGMRTGAVRIPASKSQAHRLLICAALGQEPVEIECDGISADIAATARCLDALGAKVTRQEEGLLSVEPIRSIPESLCRLPCGESGSTLRFLLPLVGALGVKAVFEREGRLPQRPLAPLDRELGRHGMRLREEGALLYCEGRLFPGEYSLPGDVSSQFISALLMALPRLPLESRLTVTGSIESAGYIRMTEQALALSGIKLRRSARSYLIPGGQHTALPGRLRVEGDWSNAAFFLCMGALSLRGVEVHGLDPASAQGDRAILELLRGFGASVELEGDRVRVYGGRLHAQTVDASGIPDLIPVLSVTAAAAEGVTEIVRAGRLRLKESDRLKSTAVLLRALGAEVEELPEGLRIRGAASLAGGKVDSFNDHRIAMSAAVAAGLCKGEVRVTGAECVEKSYPRFWEDLESLARVCL